MCGRWGGIEMTNNQNSNKPSRKFGLRLGVEKDAGNVVV